MKAPNARQHQRKQGDGTEYTTGLVCRRPRPCLAALCADEDRKSTACGHGDPRLPHRACRRTRADRRHCLMVDRLPRLQPSAHPDRGRSAARNDAARHVRRHGARTGADAGAAAHGTPRARRPRSRLLQRLRIGGGRGRAENGGAILAQSRSTRAQSHRVVQGRLSRRHHRRHGGLRPGRQLPRGVPRAPAAADCGRSPRRRGKRGSARGDAGAARRGGRRHHRRALGSGRRRHALSRRSRSEKFAGIGRPLRAFVDLR